MRSLVIELAGGPESCDVLRERAAALAGEGVPAFVIAFLPPGDEARACISEMSRIWPGAVRLGCEAVTQFANSRLSSAGSIQLFWFDAPSSSVALEIVEAHADRTDLGPLAERLAVALASADGALLFADGLRFPSQRFLDEVRARAGGSTTPIAGALASQAAPLVNPGARVFAGDRTLDSGCVALLLRGVRLEIEVVQGWRPASPVYEVTRADGPILWEIDGQSATEWYRRFFTVGDELAPMPESAYVFPLIIQGPRPERQGLIRSMKAFNDPEGAVSYWGDLHAGDKVRLGIGDGGSLVQAAAERAPGPAPDAAILCSCVGREVVLGEDRQREVEAVHEALGGVALSGFFSFGEIGPSARGRLAFYNQTAILALLREDAP